MSRNLLLLLLLFTPGLLRAQATIPVTDASLPATGNTVWTSENTYVLSGFVFVKPGTSLTIEAGTVIKAHEGQQAQATALIVARGARIFADGTPTRPIVFTSVNDDVNDPADILPNSRGLWGGVVILGAASLNTATPEQNVEGIPSTQNLARYGGIDDDDSSGVFRYVSIRYPGTMLAPGNEINGLTLGGVGRGTTVEYVEVLNSADDGLEFFGGTVNTKHLAVAFADDDAFDYDQGWRGMNQFWFSLQPVDTGDRAGEYDGGDAPAVTGRPYATPVIFNATYVGSGAGNTTSTKTNLALIYKENAGGRHYNSIFTDFKDGGVTVEDRPETEAAEDARRRLETGDLVLANNLWFGFGGGNEPADIAAQDFVQQHLSANQNQIADPMLAGISRTADGGLDPRPRAESPAFTAPRAAYPEGDFFTPVDYLGAFGSGDLWLSGWTALAHLGYLRPDSSTPVEEEPSLPSGVSLGQNFPNPFNPSTRLRFTLPEAAHVRLAVYDLLGRRVALLVDGPLPAGEHTAAFEAGALPSGLYLYRLEAGGQATARTMVLLK